jgi:TRAP-type mannitol/chloroaromatic compound transport system substrate-binding protein
VRLQRRDFLRSAAAGVTATTLATPAIAQAMPEIGWRLAAGFVRPLPVIQGGAEMFVRQLAELTDGRFRVQIVPAAAPGAEAFDAVGAGAVEMAHAASRDCFAKDPAFAIGSSIPFGLSGRQQNAWLSQGGGNEALNAFYRGYNVCGVPLGTVGARMGGLYRKEIRSAADLSGLRLSMRGIGAQVMARLGAILQELAPSTLAAALEHRSIDGVEWDGTSDETQLGLARLAPYYYAPGLAEGGTTLHCFINLDAWSGLPPAYRSAIVNAAIYADSWMEARADARTPAALKGLVAQGARPRSLPRDVIEAAERAATELYAEIAAGNATFRTMIGMMMAFRDDALLWRQVAEYSNDRRPFRAAP